MDSYPYLRQVAFTPVATQTINNGASYTSDAFSIAGYNQVDFFAYLDYNAATKLTFTLYVTDDEDGSEVFQTTSSATVAGVTTASLNTIEFTVPAAADQRFHFAFTGLNGKMAKLKVLMTSGGNLDAVTVRAIKAAI